MKIYLAARYSRKDEIREKAKQIKELGFDVTSTWFDEPHSATVQLQEITPETHREYSKRDIQEIDDCNIFVLFSEKPTEAHVRGGRHVEFGYALAKKLPILVVGPKENIFHYLEDVIQVSTWEEGLAWLKVVKTIQGN